jgi:hypothetical protein
LPDGKFPIFHGKEAAMPLALKIVLIVIAAVIVLALALVLALLALRVKIKIGYRDTLSFKLYVGGIRVVTIPKPPKKLRRLRTYTKKKAMRAAEKNARHAKDYLEMVRQHALYRALMQKYAQSKAQKKKPAPAAGAKPKQKEPQSKLDVEVLLRMISELIEAFFDGTRKGLHVHVCRLHIDVVGKDAAQTALICGSAWAAVTELLAVIDAHAVLRVRKTDVDIRPDYTGDKTRTDFSLVVSFSVFRTLHTLLSLIPVVLKHKDTLMKKAAVPTPAKQ